MLLEALRKPDPVVSWVARSSPVITAMLSSQLEAVRPKAPDDPRLDPSNRFLSEMGLCGAIHKLTLPPGYHVVSGIVYVDKLQDLALDHKFGMNGNQIICITAGQFIDPKSEALKKGDRIKILQERDPHHVIVDGELAVLFGNKKQVEKRHGLRYVTE